MPALDAVFVFIKISYKIFYNRFRLLEFGFLLGLKISGKIFSRRYELSRDSRESILGVVVCKFVLLVFSGGDSLLFFIFQIQLLLLKYFFGASFAPV